MTPLAKRLPRELRNNLGKCLGIFLGIFLLMTGSIALTSGFLLAAHSIGRIIESMRDEYAIEDGRVTTSFEATGAQLKAAEDAGGAPTYTYSFTFNDRDLSVADRTDAEEDMVDALTDADARVDDLIDADSNQGIGYARNDVDGDSMMWTTLLDIIIVIMAFVFVVLTDATIEEESAIIGTLLASGYRKREIVLHYLALPAVVGILASLLGCALGVTVFTEPMRNPYYGSYSLPPFHVYWSWEIFVECAVVPAVALILITLVGLLRKIGKTPLQFLRHEASGKAGTKRGLQLPERMGFVSRFRLRVFLRNLGNFATLFVGVAFASLLLLFGLAILPTMTHYADNLETSLVAAHQYTLKAPLELEGTDEEREQWAALDRLQSVDGTLLTAAEDAEDELDDAADVAQEAAETAMASPSAASMQAASDALEKAQDKKDALYARLDDIADALDCDRDEVIDLIDDASGIDTDNDDIHPVNTTDNGTEKIAQAEKYAVYQLQYDRGEGNSTETVTVYGVSPDSRYWKDLGVGDGHVMFGGGLVDKFGWKDGQQVSLTDKFEGKDYAFDYDGNSWGSKSDMNAYMSIDDFNELFGNDPSYFNGYVSDEELDLDSRYFAGDTTPDDMRAVGDQFIGMMSDLIGMMVGLSVFIFLLFMYLLTKAVIDRSARSISYMKVFGYRDGEDLPPVHPLDHAVRHCGAAAVSARNHRLAHRDLPLDAARLQRQHRDLRAMVVHRGVRGDRVRDVPRRGAPAHALHQARQPLRGAEGPGIENRPHAGARTEGRVPPRFSYQARRGQTRATSDFPKQKETHGKIGRGAQATLHQGVHRGGKGLRIRPCRHLRDVQGRLSADARRA